MTKVTVTSESTLPPFIAIQLPEVKLVLVPSVSDGLLNVAGEVKELQPVPESEGPIESLGSGREKARDLRLLLELVRRLVWRAGSIL